MKLSLLCSYANLSCPDKISGKEVCGITSDSGKVKDGYVFVCIKGIHTDGHRYSAEALEKGALAVVAQDGSVSGENVIYSENSRKTLSLMLDAFCGFPSKKMRFIGVTGTNGKTSVSTMIRHIFTYCGIPCGLTGTVGNFSPDGRIQSTPGNPLANMTTPDPEVLYPMLSDIASGGAEAMIMEVSSHSLALDKLAPINFDIGIFTNLTQDHLDFHKTMENYFEAKSKLFGICRVGIINCDDFYGKKIADKSDCIIKRCSLTDEKSDFSAQNVKLLGEHGVEYMLKTGSCGFEVKCPATGSFSVMNSLEACSAALEYGLPAKDIQTSFNTFRGVAGRLERLKLPEHINFSVFIDYAHTPDALLNVLKSVREVSDEKQKIILLFGCGGDRDRDKRPKMGRVATENADKVIITSDNPRSEDREMIIKDILCGTVGKNNFTVISDRREAIEYALKNAGKGDIVILAGKGHETYEIVGNKRLHFDEKEIVRSFFSNTRQNNGGGTVQ